MKERAIEAGREVMRACIDSGGALTGEHGIGVEKQMYTHWALTEQDMAATKRLGAGFNPGKIFTDEAQPHRESELHMPVSQASLMYV